MLNSIILKTYANFKWIILLFFLLFGACDYAGYPYYLSRDKLNLCIVIDRSGSMGGSPIEDARDAAKVIVDELSEDDILSVVLFNDTSTVLVEARYVTDKDAIHALLDTVSSSGGTSVSSGLIAGFNQVDGMYSDSRDNTLLLLCDGDVDSSSRTLVSDAYEEGIKTSAVAVGPGANTTLIEEIAQTGHGSFYALTDSAELSKTFQDELNILLSPLD